MGTRGAAAATTEATMNEGAHFNFSLAIPIEKRKDRALGWPVFFFLVSVWTTTAVEP